MKVVAKRRCFDPIKRQMVDPGKKFDLPEGCLASYRHLVETATAEPTEKAEAPKPTKRKGAKK